MTNRPLKVFLCHSSADKPAVRELYKKLRDEPWISSWLDEEDIFPGDDWNLEIQKAIRETDAIIVCLSKGSITKEGYVQREIKTALDYSDEKPERTVYIIPIRLEECTPPERLSKWQYADYFEGNRDRAFQRLLVSLKRRADSLGLKPENPVPVDRVSNPIKPPSLTMQYAPGWMGGDINSSGDVPNKLTLSNGMEFMRVPAGKFFMGSDNGNDDEKPRHTVNIPYDYWMARYPVTNELYNAYTISNGELHPVDDWKKKKDHPVVRIRWTKAMAYCRWLNNLIKNDLPIEMILRLPTEAEWEKAARGTDGREYSWGNDPDRRKLNAQSNIADLVGMLTKSISNYSSSVIEHSPSGDSPYGCADMLGNVWEWTNSLHRKYPYNINDGREKETEHESHVMRGGSYTDFWKNIRCSARKGETHMRQLDLGFRVCLAPPLPR
jgi:formylglycine-generating enzyme required for sulfatase activity